MGDLLIDWRVCNTAYFNSITKSAAMNPGVDFASDEIY